MSPIFRNSLHVMPKIKSKLLNLIVFHERVSKFFLPIKIYLFPFYNHKIFFATYFYRTLFIRTSIFYHSKLNNLFSPLPSRQLMLWCFPQSFILYALSVQQGDTEKEDSASVKKNTFNLMFSFTLLHIKHIGKQI